MISYLSNRSQYVFLNGKSSSSNAIMSGVPQGSILGPLFFLIYINDLPLILNNKTTNDLFADDASLYTSSKELDTIKTFSKIVLIKQINGVQIILWLFILIKQNAW